MTAELNTEKSKDALVNGIMIAASDASELIKEKLNVAKAHPWKVLGLAAALGVIVGILAYRR